jgi:hypothetical protein
MNSGKGIFIMKKIAMFLTVAVVLVSGAMVKADAMDQVLLYVPNRLVDFTDIFSITLGAGPAIGIEAEVTKYCGIGGEVGPTVQMVKGINRQYGFARQSGWDVTFLMISAENRERIDSSGSVKNYYYYSTGVPSMDKIPYDLHSGAKDFWGIGCKLAALIQLQAYIHPVEVADFILGLVFIDIKGDDFTGDDIKE